MMISHKIWKNTPDETCNKCPQNFENECRAFSMPSSWEEMAHRWTSPILHGQPVTICTLPQALRSFPPELPRLTRSEAEKKASKMFPGLRL